ncbi:MAG TPA: AsmA-like C-terminal region-containing protein, partial [Hanamia sp.]|nr:AsmA-like C-terminal region-containing protein [Hanamia sp.]
KTLKISGITVGSLLLLMFLLPVLFPGFVSGKIKQWANSAITTELNFSKARLSFFNHFPSLTLTLHDVTLMGSSPYPKDTLLKADEIAFGIDLSTVFSKKISIDKIFLDDADIFVKVNKEGLANYNVYQSGNKQKNTSADTSSTSLKIKKIQITNSNLVYNDLSVPMMIRAKNLNYTGEGDLSDAVFDLASRIKIDSFDLNYDGTQYVQSKKLKGHLITRLNTNSLALDFKKNNLLINTLPVKFTGDFEFLSNGYNMNLQLLSHKGDLQEVLSALPPEYAGWLAKTKTTGKTDIVAYLKGKYIAHENIMPSLGFNLQIRNGYISNQNIPSPVKNLFLNLDAKLPSLNTDSLYVNIDSVFFNIDKDYFSSVIKLHNLNLPTVHAKINAEMDLQKWDKAFGIAPFDVKGKYSLHFTADGSYATAIVKKGLREKEKIISSIPHFTLQSSLSNGYFKLASLPQAIQNINFQLNASNKDGNYMHTDISIEQLNANMLSDFIKGNFKLDHLSAVDADIQALIHLENIRKYYPLDSLEMAGDLNLNIISKGNYLPKQKQYPVTNATVSLKNGSLQTPYYPHPVTDIQVIMDAVNNSGTPVDMKFDLKPISFLFEGQPFTLKADLQNFENLKYDIASKGTLDVGKLYQVFSQKGFNVKGFIKTNLILRGLQSDATAGRYNRLYNSGTAEIKDITLSSDYFPRPFFIKSGDFRFNQDKMWFQKFDATYGKTNISLNGYLSNIINYAMKDDAPLTGQFNLSSNHLYVDEFMAFAGDTSASEGNSSGVIIIPSNLNIKLKAAIKEVSYESLTLNNFSGGVSINNGALTLDTTSFELIDAPVKMQANYKTLSPTRASFDYNIDAENFDIKRAYNEIKIFHDLATSASKAQGIVSLKYQLSGKLNDEMKPVYSSLKGSGVLSLQDVKVKGLKLFSAMGKATKKDSINNPNLKKIDIKTRIANNIITLDRTKMKIFGFRPRFEGQISFDGGINLSGRLGLPPLGIIGIPFTVTGTEDNPKIKIRKEKESDKLEETPEEKE